MSRIYAFWFFWIGTLLVPAGLFCLPAAGLILLFCVPGLCLISAYCVKDFPNLSRLGMYTLVIGQISAPFLLYLANR